MFLIITPEGAEFKSRKADEISQHLAEHQVLIDSALISELSDTDPFDFITAGGYQISKEPSSALRSVGYLPGPLNT